MSTAYSTFRVLIVDADKFSRDLLKEVLEALGFEGENIFRIEDGAEALETLRIKKVNVVICDRNMGTIDGVDFVRKLRDPKKSPALGVPVIFCSHQLDRQLVEEVREAGINEVIVKPITLGAVKSRIRILLEKPRPLVNLTNYVGPDRRRLHDDNVPRERRAKARRTNSSRPEEDAVDIP
jgi:CheY-like chemotaxis protein